MFNTTPSINVNQVTRQGERHICMESPTGVHDDVIKWKHFPRYWPFPVNSPHKAQWRGALMLSFICAGINGWGVTNREVDDLRPHRAYYDVSVMINICMICDMHSRECDDEKHKWYFKVITFSYDTFFSGPVFFVLKLRIGDSTSTFTYL